MDLFFNQPTEQEDSIVRPLADRTRPETLDEFVGQDHLLGPKKPLRKLIQLDRLHSLIFWGPPGCGKTTLARIIAKTTKRNFKEVSAVTSGVADLRKVVQFAQGELRRGKKTILFIDEVHRFNKAQQDTILPYVENGTVSLIGSTTENPSFEVIPPLRSRCQIYRLNPLTFEEIRGIVLEAIRDPGRGFGSMKIDIEEKALDHITLLANGDARFALNSLEASVNAGTRQGDTVSVPLSLTEEITQKTSLLYDKQGQEHYDHASAFQKSLRGSDPDASIYWLAKMLAAGEDPRFIARRLIVTASEDVGNADPFALVLAVAAAEAVERIGLPEGRIPLAEAVTYIASAPKSNASYRAINEAMADVSEHGKSFPVPNHLKDTHYPEAKRYGFGKGYQYPHDFPDHYVPQTYLPDELKNTTYYKPTDSGTEDEIRKRLENLRKRK